MTMSQTKHAAGKHGQIKTSLGVLGLAVGAAPNNRRLIRFNKGTRDLGMPSGEGAKTRSHGRHSVRDPAGGVVCAATLAADHHDGIPPRRNKHELGVHQATTHVFRNESTLTGGRSPTDQRSDRSTSRRVSANLIGTSSGKQPLGPMGSWERAGGNCCPAAILGTTGAHGAASPRKVAAPQDVGRIGAILGPIQGRPWSTLGSVWWGLSRVGLGSCWGRALGLISGGVDLWVAVESLCGLSGIDLGWGRGGVDPGSPSPCLARACAGARRTPKPVDGVRPTVRAHANIALALRQRLVLATGEDARRRRALLAVASGRQVQLGVGLGPIWGQSGADTWGRYLGQRSGVDLNLGRYLGQRSGVDLRPT